MNYPELNNLSNDMHLMGEIWKDIKGFEGYYQVSNIGRVKRLLCSSIDKNGVKYTHKELIMKVNNDSKGYPQVVLNFKSRRVARVHRLVAEAFLAPPSNELISECFAAGLKYVLVNHLDENPCNPNVNNLEWCSPLRNSSYGNTRKGREVISGSSCYCSVLTEENVSEIINLLSTTKISQEKIAEIFGVKQITISNIWTGRSWSHYTGIPWKPRNRMKRKDAKSISEQQIE